MSIAHLMSAKADRKKAKKGATPADLPPEVIGPTCVAPDALRDLSRSSLRDSGRARGSGLLVPPAVTSC